MLGADLPSRPSVFSLRLAFTLTCPSVMLHICFHDDRRQYSASRIAFGDLIMVSFNPIRLMVSRMVGQLFMDLPVALRGRQSAARQVALSPFVLFGSSPALLCPT